MPQHLATKELTPPGKKLSIIFNTPRPPDAPPGPLDPEKTGDVRPPSHGPYDSPARFSRRFLRFRHAVCMVRLPVEGKGRTAGRPNRRDGLTPSAILAETRGGLRKTSRGAVLCDRSWVRAGICVGKDQRSARQAVWERSQRLRFSRRSVFGNEERFRDAAGAGARVLGEMRDSSELIKTKSKKEPDSPNAKSDNSLVWIPDQLASDLGEMVPPSGVRRRGVSPSSLDWEKRLARRRVLEIQQGAKPMQHMACKGVATIEAGQRASACL